MRPKSLALLLLALGCGLVASIGISQVMAKRDTGEVPLDTQVVFVALQDIPQKEPVTPQMFKAEQWPKAKVPPNAISKPEDLEGRITKNQLLAGEVILQARLMGKNEKINVPKGMRVVPVKVDYVSGASGLISPGDRVDLLVHLQPNPSAGIITPTTRLALQNIKVFAVDDLLENEGKDKKGVAAKSISLLVTPEQAQKVTLCSELGQIRLVLRSLDDTDNATVADAKATDLFGSPETGKFTKDMPGPDGRLGPKPNVPSGFNDMLANLLKNAPPKDADSPKPVPPPGKQHQVLVMRGLRATEVVLEAKKDANGKEKWSPVGDDETGGGSAGVSGLPTPVSLPSTPAGEPKPPATTKDPRESGRETPAPDKNRPAADR